MHDADCLQNCGTTLGLRRAKFLKLLSVTALFSLQQPLEQFAEEQSGLRAHISEFHPHSFAGGDITHNRLGLNKASGNFKKQRQFGADRPYMVG